MLGTKRQWIWMAGIVLVLSANGYAQVSCDRFEIITKLDDHTLTVSLDTDLPDEATLMASVNRIYWQTGAKDAYSESYITGRFTVGEWRRPREIDVHDEIWQRALHERQALLARMGDPFKVKNITDSVEVSFTIPVNQKDPRFGRRNGKLTGTKVTISSSGLRIIEATEQVRLPFGVLADEANANTPIHAYNLEKGKMYRLSGHVPLTPRRKAKDIQDLSRVHQLSEGDVIEVLEKDNSGHNPWYRVKATGKTGARIGTGWINSIAALQQEIWEVDKAKEISRDSYRRLGSVEDMSYSNVKRLNIRIEIPLHRTREEVEATLKKAALTLYKNEQRRPKAISVFAYMPGDDHESAFTVGKADYAPNGKWADAGKRAPMKFSIDIGTVYFDVLKLTERFASGTQIQLRSPNGDPIRISRTTDDWSDRQMVTSVPEGTLVEIVDRKVWALTSEYFEIWFRVRLKHQGKEIAGWVRRINVGE